MKKEIIKERGEASIFIELKKGDITVYHGTDGKGKTVLLKKEKVASGSWDKIWKTLNSLK